MRRAVAVFLVALVASPLAAQVKGPTDVTVNVGKLAAVPLSVEGDEIEYAVLGGDAFGAFREFSDPKTLRFQVLGYAAGTGNIVIGTTKGGKLQPLFVVTVHVVGGPTPPPPIPPPVPPDPVPPTDPLVSAIRQAAVADRWTKADLTNLATAFQACTDVTVAGKTAALSEKARRDKLKQMLPAGVPASLYAVCSAEMAKVNAIIPLTLPDHVVTEAERDQVRAIYAKLAKACTEAAK